VKDGLYYAEVEEKKRKEERNTLMQHVACRNQFAECFKLLIRTYI
jgi:hypothetical protein